MFLQVQKVSLNNNNNMRCLDYKIVTCKRKSENSLMKLLNWPSNQSNPEREGRAGQAEDNYANFINQSLITSNYNI
jgi:hypothetical protein